MSNLEEAKTLAEEAWKASRYKFCMARRKCENCFREWYMKGRKDKEKPPYWPSDYEGKCPVCGQELSRPSIPF